ncbi:MAG: hypothetical protein KAJ73_00270 [Zetaproteobacteria bacterium]|nr:hypothetical protein [Zetaproteobacteria bacterium]
MPKDTRKRTGQIAVPTSADFISLVESPANRTGFKVIRDANGATPSLQDIIRSETKVQGKRVRKRRKDSGLLSIDLPEDADYEAAQRVMEAFGLGDDYDIVEAGGHYSLQRDGLTQEAIESSKIMHLGEGITANVKLGDATEATKRSDKDEKKHPGVKLVRVDFNSSDFPSEKSIIDWMGSKEIDPATGGVKETDSGFSFTRSDVPAKGCKSIEIEKGVICVVARADDTDVPEKVYRSVVEASYGNFGWGHLDFTAALADPEFSDKAWDATWALRDVLENVLFYSGLPLEDRKRLIREACSQYAAFIETLIDALPTTVLAQARSDNPLKQESTTMSTKPEDKTVRSDKDQNLDAKGASSAEGEIETKEGGESEFVTRSELEEVVTSAVTAAIAASKEAENVQRSEGTDEAGDAAAAGTGEESGDSIDKLATVVEGMSGILKTLRSDIDKLSGETHVARSEGDDEGAEDDDETAAKRSDSVFAGCLPGLR